MAAASADPEAAAARINQEQLIHELEHKYVLLKTDFAVVERERDVAAEQKTEIAAQLKELQQAVATRDTEIVQVKEELLQLRTERDQLGFQAKTAQSQAERRLNDIEELQQTLKEQSKQLIEAQRREVEALQKAAEQEALVEPLRHSVSRVNKELESNKQHVEWMEKQLGDKTKLIQELRQSSSKITADHEEMQARHVDELSSMRKQLESARQVSKKLESSLVQAKEHVKEVQASRMHEEERLNNELNTQRRLADLYKDAAEEANARVNALQELTETLRQSLSESEEALAHQEERTKQQVEHIFREQATASERRVEAMQEELKEAKERLEELQQSKLFSLRTASTMSDMSSAAGAAHLAAHGLSPKELCDQILALEAVLRAERDEKEQLKICMERIVKEVNEKAPMVMGLKFDLERSKESHAQVSERYESCMQELVKCRARERQAVQDKHSFERKCEALAKSVDDLSRQVQHLLFRSHDANQNVLAAGETASENLVVFKDVDELQIRNQQLLMVIRELTEAKKTRRDDNDVDGNSTHLILNGESDADSDEDGNLSAVSAGSNRLKTALKEIEELRVEREEERQMIAAIVKQRDMYRVLLAQADSKFVEASESKAAAPSIQGASPGAHQANRRSGEVADSRALRELQKEFDTYKKEKQANIKIVQDALEQARTESSSFRLGQMQAEVEAKCNKDRFEAAEKRLQGAEEEISRLRAKFDQANTLLIQHQKLLSDSEAKLEVAVAQARGLEVEKTGALREVSFMKKNEEKLLQELGSLRADNTNLLKLMDTNRQIDSSREERERRDQERLAQKLIALENKLQETYDKLESSEALSGAKIASEEQAKKIAMLELAQTKDHLASAREQLARVEEQLVAAVDKSTAQEKEVELLREQLRKGATAAAAERVAALEVELRQSQRDAQSAVEKTKSLTEGVVKYKAIAEAHEKSLAALSSETEKRKSETEAKLKALQAERDAVRGELEKARAQIKDDVTEGNKLREEIEQVTRTHQVALQESQAKQRQLQFEAEAARSELATLQQEVANLREDVSTAQENYERELKLHASQIEKFSASRKLLQEEQAKNRAFISEISELKARVAVAENEAAGKISSIEKLLASETLAKSSLQEQNKLLHSQLEHANRELRREHEARLVQSIGESSATKASTVSERDHNKELDDLRSVIAYLRKEGEILSSKHELAYQENQRYRTQVSMLETTIARLREELKRMEESANSSSAGSLTSVDQSESAKHAAQLEQLDLLRESNATLREECHKYGVRLKAEEERVKNLEAQLGPLRNSETLLKSQIESLKQEVAAANANTNRWKQRVEQLVEKTQQVDPAEHEKVCAEKAAVTKELADLQAKEAAIRTELETLKANEGKALEEEKAKSENSRKSYDKIKQFAKTWKSKAEGLNKQLADKTKELEEKAALVAVVEKKLAQAVSEKTALESKISSLEAAKAVGAGAASTALAANASWEKERQDLQERIEAETKRVTSMKEMNGRLLAGVKKLKQENTELKGQLQSTHAASDSAAPAPVARVATPEVVKASPPPTPAPTAPPAATASAPATVVAKPPVAVEKPPATATIAAPVPISSPLRTPMAAPVVAPTLKATSAPFVPAAPVVTAPTLKAVTAPPLPKAPAVVPAKPEVKETVLPIAPTPAAAVPAAGTPAPASAPVASEEDLRLVALRSMKKLVKPVVPVAAPKPVPAAIALPKPVPATTPPTAEAKPPLPSAAAAAPKPVEEKQPATSANPFAAFAPANGGFGAFGAGTTGGLVFGMPGIKLPVPASPTPVPTLAVASATTTPFTMPSATTTSAPADAVDAAPVVTGETEAQRRSQRLARFGIPETPAAPAPATLKRPATSEPETATATPQKVAKLSGEATEAATLFEDTEEEQTGSATESETAEEDATQPSPAV